MDPTVATAPGIDMSMWGLFLRADIVVKLVMLMLILASVWCWAIIFEKMVRLRRLNARAADFEENFWSGGSLDDLYDRVGKNPDDPMAAVFAAGIAMSLIMAGARRARRIDALLVHPASLARSAAGLAGRAMLATPVLGHMLREVGRDPHRAGPLFVLNLVLALAVAVKLFGFAVLVIPAMLAVPAVFYLLLSLGAD